MTTVKIELLDEQAAAFTATATAQGLTLDSWFKKLAEREIPLDQFQRAQAAAARIRDIQKRTKPDPEGWTVQDYIDRDRP